MLKKLLLAIVIVATPYATLLSASVYATGSGDVVKVGVNDASGGAPNSPATLDTTAKNVITVLTVVVGIAAVAMIIVAGLKYVTSGGNADKTKSAKNTLIFAILGLVIVALAQVIAHFVLTEAQVPGS